MRMQAKMFGIVLCALAAAACGDTGGGTGGTAGSSGTGGSGGTAGTGGTGGAPTLTVTGTVFEDEAFAPIAGATVGVVGTSISDTTDASGQFTLENVPSGEVFFSTAAAGHWGTVDFYDVPGETVGGIDLIVIADAAIDAFAGAIPRTLDPSDGIVDITYEGAEGGETGTISAASDAALTFDADDLPVVQDSVIADNEGFGDLVFTSVDPAQGPITATATGASGVTVCELDQSPGTTYPIIAKSLTFVYAICAPAP
ncbi:MAG: carboxypeptidase-like regulatory domain-containing protein [Deltaproteobacteria bacterium]|nr:carboxypeptidase-like regulatory domain-containing protein [Deltaproteobacteria bacterium]MBW2405326.1 carboxypeptidase-like regulatory domain-containing protein [Deltaproteobacteria bacterium]MBW2548111.1 carboxypeptidase-like regulatory domain-containing protein [Deltaproteobacteria bacterium]MBW2719904.1 carboxypeptidase-like regulatory domain-containing protein [Deltaproteobacteria bacterium]